MLSQSLSSKTKLHTRILSTLYTVNVYNDQCKKQAHTPTPKRTQPHTHTHTQTHALTNTHTHKNTHTQVQSGQIGREIFQGSNF